MNGARAFLGSLTAAAVCVVACGSSSTTKPAATNACEAAGGTCYQFACAVEAPQSAQDCGVNFSGKNCCLAVSDGGALSNDGGHDASHPAHDGGRDAPRHSTSDAPIDVGVTTSPIDAATNQWTFTMIPGAACLDGSETGIAINPAPTPSDDLLIFMEGGGACWDGTSCWGPVSTSFYVATGYGSLEYATDPQAALYILDRSNAANPFKDMNMVFIPYCTGDVLAGDRVTTLDYLGISHATHFVGYDNITVFLRSIAATFPHVSHAWLSGDSAGGFGAALNWEHVQDALPAAKVEVLDDSGQPIEPAPGKWAMWRTTWNLQLPAGCPGCQTDPGAFVAYYNAKYPSQRFGLISYQYDIVISPFMGLTLTQFNTELLALAANMDSSWPDGHYFILAGSSHVGLLAPTPALMTWITDMVTESPSWASEKP